VIHWSWGATQAAVMMIVIIMNGKGWRSGWLAGMVAQLVMVVFGYVIYGSWTFLLLLGPAAMFAVNWWLQPKRDKRRENEARAKYMLVPMRRNISPGEYQEFITKFNKSKGDNSAIIMALADAAFPIITHDFTKEWSIKTMPDGTTAGICPLCGAGRGVPHKDTCPNK
jgi:hypothetical protein